MGVVRLERLHDRTVALFLSKELKLLSLQEEVGARGRQDAGRWVMVLVVGEHWNQGTCSIADHELYVPSASSVPSADCCDSCSVSVTSPVLIGAGSSTAPFAPFDFEGVQPMAAPVPAATFASPPALDLK